MAVVTVRSHPQPGVASTVGLTDDIDQEEPGCIGGVDHLAGDLDRRMDMASL
jgi:hypothetical protein